MRSAYKKSQEGRKPSCSLSPYMIEGLEEIGFQWQAPNDDMTFEKRCFDLEVFKEEFGHCNVPQAYPMKEATQKNQRMIKPSFKPTLDVERSIPSAPTAGIKVEIADNKEGDETTNPSANYYDIEVAKNTQIDKLHTAPKIHERPNRWMVPSSEKKVGSSDCIDPLQNKREHRQADETSSTRTSGKRRKPSNQDASAPQKRKNLEEKKLLQPALLNQIVLTIGASNSFNSKRSLDTAMCLSNISRINHWDIGAAK